MCQRLRGGVVPEVCRDEDVRPGAPYIAEEIVPRSPAHGDLLDERVEVARDPHPRRRTGQS
jgi:hypothetical protein